MMQTGDALADPAYDAETIRCNLAKMRDKVQQSNAAIPLATAIGRRSKKKARFDKESHKKRGSSGTIPWMAQPWIPKDFFETGGTRSLLCSLESSSFLVIWK
jgi:hypothetical protein